MKDKSNFPPIYSIILFNINDDNHIGLVNKIIDDNMEVLLLDIVGKKIVNINDTWTSLSAPNIQALRNYYHMFIGKNTNQQFIDKYKIFMDTFIIPKK
jgi:hypothetical protein